MFRKTILFIACLSSLNILIQAEELIVASQGKSDYQIVLPDKKGTPFDFFLETGATVLRDAIKKATGANLAIAYENNYSKSHPSIFIGGTEAAKNNGIDIASMKGWTYVIKTVKKNIFLAGNDSPYIPGAKSRNYNFYYLGTIKAITSFMEKYIGAKFILPSIDDICVTPKNIITVPMNIDAKASSRFEYCTGSSGEMFYDTANNFFRSGNYGSYGGHSHDVAIPHAKYYSEHPEYFALINGKRHKSSTKPQYCLSNPDVQKLIYQELLRKLDEGYEYAQLGQSDGFRPCECENCKKFYGVDDFGEKIWIMHKKMAERLLNDRPGKKVVMLSYAHTRMPPKTFDEFPSNVRVEITRYSEENFANWKKCKVPEGLVTYVYNWGFYQYEGFTPKLSPVFCRKQISTFVENNVRGIYRCGYGELFGLEGPIYYIYGKLLEEPDSDTDKLATEFCQSAYGTEGGKAMKDFFDVLHKRLDLKVQNDGKDIDWNDSNLLSGNVPDIQNNLKLLKIRYPSEITVKMDELLRKAEKTDSLSEREKFRIKLVRTEFDYLSKTSLIAELFDAYVKNPSAAFARLAEAIKARNTYIAAIPDKENKIAPLNGISLFAATDKDTLKTGGRLTGILKTPYYWDVDLLEKYKIIPDARKMRILKVENIPDTNASPYQKTPMNENPQLLLHATMDKKYDLPKTYVSASYDKNNLYLHYRMNDIEKADFKNNQFVAYLSPDGSLDNNYIFRIKAPFTSIGYGKSSAGETSGTLLTKSLSKLTEGISNPQYDEKTKTLTVKISIPFSIFKATPLPSKEWYGNFMRRVISDKETNNYIWEPNILPRNSSGGSIYEAKGKFIFE